MRISTVSLTLPLVLLLGCPGDDGGDEGGSQGYCESCNLDALIPLLAADDARDCGRVGVDEDPTPVVECIEEALEYGTPFTARQSLQGIDSFVELGFLVDDDGAVQQLFYDSNICGVLTCAEGCGPFVRQTECRNPRIGAVPAESLIDCDYGESFTVCEPPAA
jgi:hypothetical protein